MVHSMGMGEFALEVTLLPASTPTPAPASSSKSHSIATYETKGGIDKHTVANDHIVDHARAYGLMYPTHPGGIYTVVHRHLVEGLFPLHGRLAHDYRTRESRQVEAEGAAGQLM
jgi:hypothetical protein